MKIENVKATKLKRGDKIAIGGTKHTITMLTLHFGGKRERVTMHMHGPDVTDQFTNLSVPSTARFTVYRKK